MRLITDTFQYCQQSIPRWNTISISGYHIREAGSTAVQEVAFTLANAIAYVETAIKAGLQVDDLHRSFPFSLPAITIFWRRLPSFALPGVCGGDHERALGSQNSNSMRLRFHTQTGGSTLTAQQPENNIVRTTIQALAAVLGGTQSLHTNSMDEALWLPTEKSVRIALRTQQIIAHESGVADSVDPLAGSYLVEYLTNEIESRARHYIDHIDHMGGALAAIENGFIQREIQDSAYAYQKSIENHDQTLVGVNDYQIDETVDIEPLKVDPAVELGQIRRLKEFKEKRDGSRVHELLQTLENAARSDENLLPLMVHCVEQNITLGEICGVLRQVWGEYQPPVWA